MLESKTYKLIVLFELTIVRNEDCTPTLSSRCHMRYRHREAWLIHKVLWHNARQVLTHRSSAIAVPDLLYSSD